MLRGASSKGHMQREGGCAVVRQRRLIAVVVTLLIGCAVLLGVGCARTRSEAPKEKKQHEHTEVTNKEQAHSERCEETLTIKRYGVLVVTNDVPGCPKGGLLLGTDKIDQLDGLDGDDEIRGLGGPDLLWDGPGNDVLYGEDGNDMLGGGLHNTGSDGQRDKFYCGAGKDLYVADKNDYVDSSCEKENLGAGGA